MRRSGRLASKPKVVFDNLDEEEAEPKKKQGREEEDSFGDAKEEVEEEEEGEEEPVSDFSEEPKKKKKNNSKRKSAAPAPKKKAKKKEKEEEKEEEQKEGEEEEEEEEEKKPKVYPKSKYISQEQFAAIDAAAEEYARNQIPVLKVFGKTKICETKKIIIFVLTHDRKFFARTSKRLAVPRTSWCSACQRSAFWERFPFAQVAEVAS